MSVDVIARRTENNGAQYLKISNRGGRGSHLIDRAVVYEDGKGQFVLIPSDVRPSRKEGVSHSYPDLLRIEIFVRLQLLSLQIHASVSVCQDSEWRRHATSLKDI
jgi:hypothetical protein